MFFWLLTSDYFVVSNEYASGKCIGVKVYILIRKCSGVKVKVGWNIKTQVKYRYSQKILKYCNEVLLLCYNTPLVINHWLSELFKAADSFTNETLLLLGDAHQGHVQPGQNGGKRLLNGIGGALNSLAVLNMRSSAILRPCVLVLRHHQPSKFSSNSQERKYRGRMKVPGCVLDIEDASSADLRESSR